jgi:trimethyllysine dioxygenase
LYTTGGVGEEGYKGWSVFELGVGGCVDSVRWNNEDRSLGFRGPSGEPATAEEIEGWYRAARVWEGLLRKRGNELWHKLEPGTVVVIDNTRVMHGRSGFVGERKMCGAYVGRDEWVSWKEVLEREEREERPGGGDGDEEKKGERDVWNLGY